MVSFDDVNEKELKRLKKYGYEFIKPKSKQEIARLKGKTTLVLYKTGKLLIQGKKQDIEETTKLINFLCIAKGKKGVSGVAIGTDESLKGDTFGGIVVAGFMADEKGIWHDTQGAICYTCHTDNNAKPNGIRGVGFCGYCHTAAPTRDRRGLK